MATPAHSYTMVASPGGVSRRPAGAERSDALFDALGLILLLLMFVGLLMTLAGKRGHGFSARSTHGRITGMRVGRPGRG